MSALDDADSQGALPGQLRWFIRLRWGITAGVIAGALVDRYWVGWYEDHGGMLAVGGCLLGYNVLLHVLLGSRPRPAKRPGALIALAWLQIVTDLACLTVLTLWTGGVHSPLLGFYVWHMVIASILLPHLVAYAGAAMSGVMLTAGLWLTGQWPDSRPDKLLMLGWLAMLVGTVYLASNITRKLREHRRRLMEHRQRLVSMSQELRRQQRAMVQQDKMAAMGQMAAGVAHEIANPLACMDSLMQLVQRKPERMKDEVFDKLREQIVRISEIVRQLTHFAHPDEARWETISIHDVVDRALQMMRFDDRIRKGHVRVEQQRSRDACCMVTAQPHALVQVLVNVILNALDAMADEPDPQLDIRAWGQEGKCFIEVTDNGHGISPEHRDHLFEPFFTTKPVGRGTGLGLAISYRLIRSHGGDIEAENLEKGARFTIHLPAAP